MSEVFLSLTELGKLYGVSSHQIGKWLKQVGLRTKDNKPSPRAFKEGYVEQRGSTQPGTYYWIWHGEKTLKVLPLRTRSPLSRVATDTARTIISFRLGRSIFSSALPTARRSRFLRTHFTST
jgi:hypothetical protein